MQEKTNVVISTLVDATIREYSPDTEYLIFRAPGELGTYTDTKPIRATTMYITEETLGQTNTSLEYIRNLLTSAYIHVDRVVFVVSDKSVQHIAINYLVEQYDIKNWEVIIGNLSKAYVTEVIQGTYRSDNVKFKRKAVYRIPRADYVREELKNRESLSEEYIDDDNDLKDIPDEPVPEQPLPVRQSQLRKYFISGDSTEERTAFAFVASQYLALTGKTIIVESDVEYHTVTEYATKSSVDVYLITIDEIYEDLPKALSNIVKSECKLIVVGTINRVDFNYRFIVDLLYYNLIDKVDYIIYETDFTELPPYEEFIVVVPSTMKGVLSTSENLDRSYYEYARFIGINLKALPQVHLNSGVVITTLLRDLMSDDKVLCPVITLSSLKLNGSAYDLGAVLGGGNKG